MHETNSKLGARALKAAIAVTAAVLTCTLVPAVDAWAAGSVQGSQDQLNHVKNQLASAEQQAAAIQAEQQSAQAREDELSQQYEVAQQKVASLDSQLTSTRAQIAQTEARVNTDEARLRAVALQAYMSGTSSSEQFESLFVTGGPKSLATQEYRKVASANVSNAIDQLQLAKQSLNVQESSLQSTEVQAKAAAEQVGQAQAQAQVVEQQVSASLASEDSQVKSLLAQKQAAQQSYDEAVYQQQLAAEEAAEAEAAHSGGGGALSTDVAVPQSAQGALEAAESQLGVPYVWGGESPRGSADPGFDCSGLMQWSWAQAGVSLPRTAQEQYDATTHIPLSDLEPGDLLFWDDGTSSVQHVGMYVGNGNIIDAPETGENVQIQPMWTNGLVGAGRV